MANSQKGKIDMTTGHIMRNIILFAIPIIIGNVLQQLYTTVDALVIGKYCGDTSLAAVGTSSQPVEVLLFLRNRNRCIHSYITICRCKGIG